MVIKHIEKNQFSRPGAPLDSVYGLIFHWVGNAGTSADANARYFETLKKQDPFDNEADVYACAHYIVDEKDAIEIIPPAEVAYHSGSTWWNRNSIGIEMCHDDWKGRHSSQTMRNIIKLTVKLCIKYDIDPLGEKRLQLHYDITGKLCPKWWVEHPADWEHFKKDIAGVM